MIQFFREFRCWLYFRHVMERLGRVNGCMMWQCGICAKTISVDQRDMHWI